MEKTINTIAAHVKGLGARMEQLAGSLCKAHDFSPDLKVRIRDQELSGIRICGVDGGFLKKEYHGCSLILRRAVAVCFNYEKGRLGSVAYWPSRKPVPEPIVVGPEFAESDFNLLASLKRIELEIATAIEAVKQLKPNVLVLDGSIVLYPADVPRKDSSAFQIYQSVIELFKKLYQICSERRILLVGAVEDSRGRRYCNLLRTEIIPRITQSSGISTELKKRIKDGCTILPRATDTLFLYYLLRNGERTGAFRYTEAPPELPLMKDLGKWKNSMYVMYLKAVEYDRPLRLDFLAQDDVEIVADRAAAIIWAISKQNRTYAYPSVLIEADARAKLSEHEITLFKAAIAEKIGRSPSLFELRRETRPF